MPQVPKLDVSPDTASRNEPILQVRNLNVSFEKQIGFMRGKMMIHAVKDVSFDLHKSEFVSIVGESGSGKTTIAMCLMGLQRPNSGSITYNGMDLTQLRGKELHKYLQDVQIVYQDPFESLNPRQDAYTAISTPIKYLTDEKNETIIRSRVSALLEEVELDPGLVMHRYPHQLSGGQRQRINIARALASNPKILVADEPITMLDAAQRLNVLSLLMQLKEKHNLTVLMITHELTSAKATSNRIMIMYYGKLVEVGEANEVLSKPLHPYVELIMSVTPSKDRDPDPSLSGLVKSSQGSEDSPVNVGSYQGCVFRNRCKYAKEQCERVEPLLEEKANHHSVACHYPLSS
jgi:oligopeptide transport system ATP-binding protein